MPPRQVQTAWFNINALHLTRQHIPQTCKNFAELAKKGYYNGVMFHRIIAVRRFFFPRARVSRLTCVQDFMIQGGDPTGTGRGGTSIYGQRLYVFSSCLTLTSTSSLLTVKTKYIPNCGSQALGSSPWPIQVPTPTVRPRAPLCHPRYQHPTDMAPKAPNSSSPSPRRPTSITSILFLGG